VAPALIVSTAAAAVAVSAPDGGDSTQQAAPGATPRSLEATLSSRRSASDKASRSDTGGRPPLTDIATAKPGAVDTARRFATTDLNVWSGPGERFKLRTVLDTGSKLAVTGATSGKWAQIVYHGKFGWISASYVAKKKPKVEKPETEAAKSSSSSGVTEAPCPLGSGVEAGLTPDAIRVYRSVCAAFPQVTSYGGVRTGDGGEHGTGQALDIMVSGSLGDSIAAYVRDNASQLGVSEVLWAQQIWTVQRSSEGWRTFSDRGSVTGNHFDHVHVTVYGSSGG
jgi:hypothetical protein